MIYLKTKNNSYTVQDVTFTFSSVKIICTGKLYYNNATSRLPASDEPISGVGYMCSEAHAKMLDNIQTFVNEIEKTNVVCTDESFETNVSEPREE